MRLFTLIALLIAPAFVHAQTVFQAWNVLNLFTGILLAISMVFFGGGFALYLARLGRTYRSEGLNIMQWGVSTLFVFVVLSTISRWWLLHPDAFPWVFALIITGVILFVILPATLPYLRPAEKKDGEKH